MATTFTPNLSLSKPAASDRGWDAPLNLNATTIDALAPLAALYARPNESPSTTLTVAVNPGSFRAASGAITAYAGGTIAIPTGTTRNVWLTDASTPVLAIGASWPTVPYVPLAVVVGGVATITSVTDARVGSMALGFPGLTFKEGAADARMGVATLVAGTKTVSTTAITANSRVFLTVQSTGGTPGFLSKGAVVAGTSFVINSSSNSDSSIVAWLIVEPE